MSIEIIYAIILRVEVFGGNDDQEKVYDNESKNGELVETYCLCIELALSEVGNQRDERNGKENDVAVDIP